MTEVELLRRRLDRERAIRLAAEDIGEKATRELDGKVEALTAANAQLTAARDDLEALVNRLAMPVLETWPRLLAVPVVGAVTSERMARLQRDLLEAVVRRRARVVILDISGAGVVDTPTFKRLLALLEAVRLMGCHAILTGLSPELASALAATPGLDLDGVATYADTASALTAAFDRLGLAVRPIGTP